MDPATAHRHFYDKAEKLNKVKYQEDVLPDKELTKPVVLNVVRFCEEATKLNQEILNVQADYDTLTKRYS